MHSLSLQLKKHKNGEIRAVVTNLGPENIVQIVTDNGSNYKKACQVLRREYPAITWLPFVAHTINLMLKSVGDFREHDIVIQSARAISRWLYNHSKLHEMMKAAIGGELVRWNATRFGTNYLFLDSFLRRKDKFIQWMASSSLDTLVLILEDMHMDKVPTLSEVLLRYTIVKHEYESLYKNDRDSLDKYMAIVDRRMNDLANGTYMNAAAVLNPRTHYAYGTGPTLFEDLREAFERLTDVTTAAEALIEAETWWSMFGSSTPTLSMLARRLVSQCASSSGCERNWSTFAFIHTKVRNRLSYKKLHKLVYVNYNLRIQNNLNAGIRSTLDDDPFQRLMELTLNEDNNPVRDWMETGRSNAAPELDEEDTDSDVPLPTHLVTDIVNTPDLQQWAATTVGDTHTGKRKK
ncbi:uncharacterized protein LOC133894997 [Phragmites australis]|uniref:uncharacterized protein LOC133894997 n=1 Tax=Phragmites australis TaxID=29695 RepID=UPI002D7874D1|nr:uncharacterized protein LOC133894997 [Phragmites australis]